MSPPILLVDDDEPFRSRLARALIQRGVDCLTASDLDGAVATAMHVHLQGVILDLRMPGQSGLELIPTLLSRQPNLPIVVLTGYGSIPTALEAVRRGARDMLLKPADPDAILAALRGVRPQREPDQLPEVPTLDRVEWEHIHRILAETGGNISRTAQLLGIDRRSLQRKLGKYPPSR